MAVAIEKNNDQMLRPQHTVTPQTKPGATLAVASIATALVLIVFTVPLTTLTNTARKRNLTREAQTVGGRK